VVPPPLQAEAGQADRAIRRSISARRVIVSPARDFGGNRQAAIRRDLDIHEEVECRREWARLQAQRTQGGAEIVEAVRVVSRDADCLRSISMLQGA